MASGHLQLRVGCTSAEGELWISIPLPTRQSQSRQQIALVATPAVGSSSLPTWQARLLERLLADPEVQAQLAQANTKIDHLTIARWATAKHDDAQVAEAALRRHLQWRSEAAPGGQISEVCLLSGLGPCCS